MAFGIRGARYRYVGAQDGRQGELDGSSVRISEATNVAAIAFSSDGRQLAFADSRQIKIVNGESFASIRTLAGRPDVATLLFSPDSSRLAVATRHDLRIHVLGAASASTAAIDIRWLGQLARLPIPDPRL